MLKFRRASTKNLIIELKFSSGCGWFSGKLEKIAYKCDRLSCFIFEGLIYFDQQSCADAEEFIQSAIADHENSNWLNGEDRFLLNRLPTRKYWQFKKVATKVKFARSNRKLAKP